jgi:ankyrin repeat protein/serine/threonine protein kinase
VLSSNTRLCTKSQLTSFEQVPEMEASEEMREACRDATEQPLEKPSHDMSLKALDVYFAVDSRTLNKFTDEDIYHISILLTTANSEWKALPRLYIISRIIGHLDVLERLITLGITDLWLPLSIGSFPATISENVRLAFLEWQWIVLTKAIDLENGERGRHQSFGKDELFPFKSRGTLGSGAFSTVDRVVSLRSNIEYARKRLRRGAVFLRQAESIGSLVNELKVLKRAHHRHIVELVGSYSDPLFLGILFSPVADMNLDEFYTAVSGSSSNKALLRSFYGCLASGLSYLHEMKIRHRDIKPQNILVKGETVFFTDFNVSMDWVDGKDSATNDTIPLMTRRYAAPEMLSDGPRGSASDVWSLGCVFLEMTTVLKGLDLSDVRVFFEGYGSGSTIFASNYYATESWIVQLRVTGESNIDNQPLEWIGQMLKPAPQRRVTAKELFNTINIVNGSERQAVYCRNCCFVEWGNSNKAELSGTSFVDKASMLVGRTSDLSQTPLQSTFKAQEKDSPVPSAATDELIRSFGKSSIVTDRPVRPDRTPRASKTALFAAIRHVDAQRLSSLIGNGADVESEDMIGRKALYKAVESESETVVSVLLKHGAKVNEKTKDGMTALHEAARRNVIVIMRQLLGNGADPSIQRDDGKAALHIAVENENLASVKCLVDAGADLDARTNTGKVPLHGASWTGNDEIARVLLDNGASPNSEDAQGSRPIHMASGKNYDRVLRVLIEKGAEVNCPELQFGFDPISLASDLGNEKVVNVLLEHNVDRRYRDHRHEATALHLAAKGGHASIARSLVRKGWEVNARNKYGYTPLHTAAYGGHCDFLRVLLDGGSDMNILTPDGATALMFAAHEGQEESVKLLIDHGSDLEARNTRGLTPLHAAAENGHINVVMALLEYGADPAAIAEDGSTALDRAEAVGHEEVVELFESLA